MYEPERAAGLRSYRYKESTNHPSPSTFSHLIGIGPWHFYQCGWPQFSDASRLHVHDRRVFRCCCGCSWFEEWNSSRLYFGFAACFWIYSTMDNIDGKQARRTNSSSPLGELFWSRLWCFKLSYRKFYSYIASFGLGYSWRSLIVLFISSWAFICRLGKNITLVSFTWATSMARDWRSFNGNYNNFNFRNIWKLIWFKEMVIPQSIRLFDWFNYNWFVALFVFYYVPSCLWSVYCECKKKEHLLQRILQLFPMTVGTLAVAICYHPAIPQFKAVQISFYSLRRWEWVFGKMATKIIYAHVAKCPFPFH